MLTSKMKKIKVAVLDSSAAEIKTLLLKEGLVHFIKTEEISLETKKRLNAYAESSDLGRIVEGKKRAESLLKIIDYGPEFEDLTNAHIEQNLKLVDEHLTRVGQVLDGYQYIKTKQKNLQEELNRLEEIRLHTRDFSASLVGKSEQLEFLNIFAGFPTEGTLDNFCRDALKYPVFIDQSALNKKDNPKLILFALKRDADLIENVLKKYKWKEKKDDSPKSKIGEIDFTEINRKIQKTEEEQSDLAQKALDFLITSKDSLLTAWKYFSCLEKIRQLESYCLQSEKTVIFSGWSPARQVKNLITKIENITVKACIIEVGDPEKSENVPVEWSSPKLLSPFKMLVENYGTPEYRTVNPTALLAIFYSVMYGLMFADMGHGLVVFLMGLGGYLATKRAKNQNVNRFFQLIIWSGFFAMLAGLCFGVAFGLTVSEPLLFDFHGIVVGHPKPGLITTINGLLAYSIYIGVVLLGVGLIVNCINRVLKRQWRELLFERTGLAGVWLYGGGIYVAYCYVESGFRVFPPANILAFTVGAPAILMVFNPIIEALRKARHDQKKSLSPKLLLGIIMEWLLELAETFISYLSNTLSFMRIAGMAIAHVGLMTAFFKISAMVSGPGNVSVAGIIVLILGNLLVIALEGLTSGIQAIRLNYYEFFSKFFEGNGTPYAPLSLKSDKQ